MTNQEKREELYGLIDEMQIALMTTRRSDGMLVTRPMATQEHQEDADLWFVTNIETDKIDELEFDPNISIGYYNPDNGEWVSVSGKATITQDRAKIHELYSEDWKMWFGDEGGERDGGPDDPRLALIFVDAMSVHYMKNKHSKPVTLLEMGRAYVAGDEPDIAREVEMSQGDLEG